MSEPINIDDCEPVRDAVDAPAPARKRASNTGRRIAYIIGGVAAGWAVLCMLIFVFISKPGGSEPVPTARLGDIEIKAAAGTTDSQLLIALRLGCTNPDKQYRGSWLDHGAKVTDSNGNTLHAVRNLSNAAITAAQNAPSLVTAANDHVEVICVDLPSSTATHVDISLDMSRVEGHSGSVRLRLKRQANGDWR